MGGAADVSEAFVEACARGYIARVRAELEADRRRAETLRARAAAAAEVLTRRFGVGRVWLIGSLAWGEPHTSSDVDLLVEGLAPADWSSASGAVEQSCGTAVDLVRVEEAPEALTARARAEGVRLDERG